MSFFATVWSANNHILAITEAEHHIVEPTKSLQDYTITEDVHSTKGIRSWLALDLQVRCIFVSKGFPTAVLGYAQRTTPLKI